MQNSRSGLQSLPCCEVFNECALCSLQFENTEHGTKYTVVCSVSLQQQKCDWLVKLHEKLYWNERMNERERGKHLQSHTHIDIR